MLMLLLFSFLGPKCQILPQGKGIGQIHIFSKKKLFFFYKNMYKPLTIHCSIISATVSHTIKKELTCKLEITSVILTFFKKL